MITHFVIHRETDVKKVHLAAGVRQVSRTNIWFGLHISQSKDRLCHRQSSLQWVVDAGESFFIGESSSPMALKKLTKVPTDIGWSCLAARLMLTPSEMMERNCTRGTLAAEVTMNLHPVDNLLETG
ncbi:MAG: hypothetical protein AB2806_12495 [Candidatus Thiodiazotropha sp.]